MKDRIISLTIVLVLFILICCSIAITFGPYIELPAMATVPVSSTSPVQAGGAAPPAPRAQTQIPELGWFAPLKALGALVSLPFRVILIGVVFLAAFIIHRLAWIIAGALLYSPKWSNTFLWSSDRLKSRLHLDVLESKMRVERQKTIRYLIASTISVAGFTTAVLLTLGQFLSGESLAIFTGLFTAAFGFGARPIITDLLSGISIIFEDNFDVGEKIEVVHATGKIQGVVESLNLRATSIRASTGELYLVPNGEMRIVRNFSRGRFSKADFKLKVDTVDLNRVLPLLEDLGQEAVTLLPDLLEPWQVISEVEMFGEHTELTLLIKARFGKAAEMRPRLLTLVRDRLAEADISLSD
jgi:small conductance mechanosensitive channel